MSKKKTTLILSAILFLGLVVRLINFGKLPLSLNRDEAALGYNAFALATEGIDEWGESWPLVFKSFGDFKLPGYIYLLVPLIKVFGVNDIIIRLPSLAAGMINIILLFFIAKKIFPKQKLIWLLSSFGLATMPWAIHYSRIGFEAHVALSLTLLTIDLFLRILDNKKFIIPTLIIMFLSMLTYNAPLLLGPFFVVSFIILFKKFFKEKSPSLLALVIGSLIIIGISARLVLSVSQAKTGITIFTDPTLNNDYRQQRVAMSNINPTVGKIFGNKFVFFSKITLKNYLNSYSPKFLLSEGGQHPWHSIPGWAHLTRSQYFLFIIGLIFLVIKKKKTKSQLWLLTLLLIAPLPAAITVDAPHTTRSLLFLSLTPIIIGFLLYELYNKKKLFKNVLGLILITLALETGWYLTDYFKTFPQNHSSSWNLGLKQTILNSSVMDPEKEIIITDYQGSPYIYVLLYEKIPPSKFKATVKYYPPDNAGLIHVDSFDRYRFIDKLEDEKGLIIDRQDSGQYNLELKQ